MSACSQQYVEIGKVELLSEVNKMKVEGYRLGQISCTTLEKFDLLYTFAKDDDLVNLRVVLDFEEEIDSISCFYPYAFIYENEMKDLFNVKITNINLDFNGYLYKTTVKHPFSAANKSAANKSAANKSAANKSAANKSVANKSVAKGAVAKEAATKGVATKGEVNANG